MPPKLQVATIGGNKAISIFCFGSGFDICGYENFLAGKPLQLELVSIWMATLAGGLFFSTP
jgi:hypothetical protein